MAQLGLRPVLVGAVGADFADYRSWLERHGVDCDSVHVSEIAHTARFVCTTDDDMCQIASFYAGAMSEARNIELAPVADRVGGLDLVLISAERPGGDGPPLAGVPRARLRASPPTRRSSWPGWPARTSCQLIDGAAYLLTNDYEKSLLESKTGLSDAEVLDRVGVRVTTLGKDGVEITGRDIEPIHVPVARRCSRSTRPASATASGPASSPACPGASAWSAPPRSARCWPRWSSRPSAPRSTTLRPRRVRQAPGRVLRRRSRRRRAAAPAGVTARLVVFAGLPGVGKSTLAARVGAALPAPVLAGRHDRPRAAPARRSPSNGRASPRTAWWPALAEAQLGIGLTTSIVDAVNPRRRRPRDSGP